MEIEFARLQRRVMDLEAALAMLSRKTDRTDFRRRGGLMPLICASILALWVGILLGGGTRSSAAPFVPTKVAQPFEVVDGTGRVIFGVYGGSNGYGHVELYDPKGDVRVGLGGDPGAGFATMRVRGPFHVLRPGSNDFGVGMGLNTDGDGLIILKGRAQTKNAILIAGNGVLDMVNAQQKKVVSLLVNGFGGGGLLVANSNGTEVVNLFAAQSNLGILQLFDAAGQERVTLGTLTNGKGDVCASGNQGKNCLSRLNPKY